MNMTSISFFNLQILEPSTFISDVSLGIACLIFYRYIINIASSKTHKYYALFFLFMSLSGFFGAFAHALYLYTGKPLQYIGWLMSGISVFSLEKAIFLRFPDENKKKLFIKISGARLLVISLITIAYMNFMIVKINIVIGLLLTVMPLMLFQYYSAGIKYYLYIALGIILAVIPALLHSLNFRFEGWINLNDFNHYFLIICLFFMFLGQKGLIEIDLAQAKQY
jgi:hypothetical protein